MTQQHLMPPPAGVLSRISMVSANFGNGLVYRAILDDWFSFLGGKPGEVVVVDGGSDRETQSLYWQLFQEGLIDKLQLIRSEHQDNDKEKCFIQEHTAGAVASNDYLLWFKIDTLPYRQGHDDWLEQAVGFLDRPEVFAVVGSVNYDSRERDAFPGWYYSRRFSENFALMKRERFIDAISEFAGDYVASGFRGRNPGDATGQGRYLVEVAMQQYMANHDLYSLMPVEREDFSVFHTNLKDEQLLKTRERYLRRENVKSHLNARNFTVKYPDGVFYGMPPKPLMTRLRIRLGASAVGPYWRALKRLCGAEVVA